MSSTMVATPPRMKIFLSSASADRELAASVAAVLSRNGVDVWEVSDVAPGGDYSDRVRQALHRSSAAVIAITGNSNRRDLPAATLFEIGAASGAGKPVFVVVDGPGSKLPFNVPGLHVIPVNRVGEIPMLVADLAESAEQ